MNSKAKYSKFNRFKIPVVKEAPSPQKRTWTPSEQQEAIFQAVASDDHVVVEAGAGCGKTTTQIEAVKPLADDQRVCLLAFNKSIADELRMKVPEPIEAKTIHAMGLACCKMNVARVKIDDRRQKMESMIEEFFPLKDFPKLSSETNGAHRARYYAYSTNLRKLVSMTKNYGLRNTDIDSLGMMAANYDIIVQTDEALVQQVNQLLDASYTCVNVVDFDDMVWLPIVHGWKLPQYDLVGVDEAQDLNPLRQQFVQRLGGRQMVIGDSHQAIYGFNGADVKSMQTMRNLLSTTGVVRELPLNITRRCPKAHVEIANQIFPGSLQAAPEAPDGTVGKSHISNLVGNLQPKDFVLCRTNAPLIWLALRLVRANRPVVIMGRDFCESLKYIIKQCGGETQTEFLNNLRKWYVEQIEKFQGDSPRQERMREVIKDKYDSLVAVCGECTSAASAIERLDTLFGEKAIPNAVVLSSIHKAKGLEADRVFITHPHLLPHPMCKQDWEIEQEANLKYVAVTRSKSHLEWVEGDYRELNK